MAAERIDVLLIGPEKPVIAKGLATFNVVKLPEPNAREKFFSDKNVQEGGGRLFTSRDPVVSMPAELSYPLSFRTHRLVRDRLEAVLRRERTDCSLPCVAGSFRPAGARQHA